MIHRCLQKSETASNSASGSPQKRAKISKHTYHDLTLMPTARVDEPLWNLPVTSVLEMLLLDSCSLLRFWPGFYKNSNLLLRLSLRTKYPNAKIPSWSTTLCCASVQNLGVVLWGPALSITQCPTKEKGGSTVLFGKACTVPDVKLSCLTLGKKLIKSLKYLQSPFQGCLQRAVMNTYSSAGLTWAVWLQYYFCFYLFPQMVQFWQRRKWQWQEWNRIEKNILFKYSSSLEGI